MIARTEMAPECVRRIVAEVKAGGRVAKIGTQRCSARWVTVVVADRFSEFEWCTWQVEAS